MADTDDTNRRDEEIEALESAIKSDAKTYKCLNAYDPTRAAKELRAKWYAHHRATGEELDPRKLLQAAEAHLADEAKRLSKVTKKTDDNDSDDDKADAKAKPAKKPAPKKQPSPEEHRRNVARKFAEGAWAKQQEKKSAEAKAPKNETPEARRSRIARTTLKYREQKKAG